MSNTISADTQHSFTKELNPYSHTYTQDTLKGVRLARPQIEALAHSKLPLIFFTVFPALMRPLTLSSDDNVFLSSGILFPYLMFNIGVDGSTERLYDIAKNLQKLDIKDIQALGRCNLVLGSLYRYPFYIRGAYDYIPFGDHHSEVIQARHVITRTRLQRKCVLAEIGGAWTSTHSEGQGSISMFGESDIGAIIFKGQYSSMFSTAFNAIQGYQIGVGVGCGGNGVQGEEGVLMNGYSHLFFSNAFDVYVEYLYDSLIGRYVSENGYRAKLQHRSPHTLHIEGAKHFKSIVRWDIPSIITIGYMQGDTTMETAVRGVFAAYKFKLLKEHIHVLVGGRCDVLNHQNIKPLMRIDVFL